MNTPATPAAPAAPSLFGSLTSMFSGPKKPANAVAPAQAGGRRRRGKKTRASRSRKHRTRRHRK